MEMFYCYHIYCLIKLITCNQNVNGAVSGAAETNLK